MQTQDEIPEVYLIKMGVRHAGDYFAELFLNKRIESKVPVMVDDFVTSFYFAECDKFGYPKRRWNDYLSFMESPKIVWDGDLPDFSETKVYRKTIEVTQPLISHSFRPNWYPEQPYIFMWEGKVVDKSEIPVEKLDVKYLLNLAQEAIKNREGIIFDEVLKNRLIK